MTDDESGMRFLRPLDWHDLLLVLAILVVSRVAVLVLRWGVTQAAEWAPVRLRLPILRWAPAARLAVEVAAGIAILPILVEPTFRNTVALLASLGLALAFALKDYASCLVAGLVTILEHPYQPGDWIEVDGTYGEVKAIGMRAVHLVTKDDNEVIIPHARIWATSVSNATGGSRSLLCVAPFHVHADHDGHLVRQRLMAVASASPYLKLGTTVSVTALEKPWGTLYRVKAYVRESREQFQFITDLTLRGKEALRALHVPFAQVPFSESGK